MSTETFTAEQLKSLVAEVERLRAENEEQRLELLVERGEQEGGLPGWVVQRRVWYLEGGPFGEQAMRGQMLIAQDCRAEWIWTFDQHRAAGREFSARNAIRAAEAWLAEQAVKVTP